MKYVLYDPLTDEYYAEQPHRWFKTPEEAAKFNSEQAANNAKNSSGIGVWMGAAKKDVRPVACGDDGGPLVEIKSREEAEQYYAILDNALRDLVSIQDYIYPLLQFYEKDEFTTTGMQQDILHKLEFDNVVGIMAVKFARQLKDIRLKRRTAKNRKALLSELKATNIKGILKIASRVYENQAHRVYVPRELPELFEGK